jgi:outer membrane lipoprotein-sorting protein
MIWSSVAAIAALSVSYAQSGPGTPSNLSPTAVKTTEQAYKNIQVLKGIPSDELIPAMQFITAALGVECGFCHVENHYDQDDKKPKQTARKMMQMMMALNQDRFENRREVTCNTCHRGSRIPESIPAINEGPARPQVSATENEPLPPDLPSGDQLIQRYTQAIGGADAIQKISSRVEICRVSLASRQAVMEVFDKAPGKRVTITHLPDGDSIAAFDGHRGWLTAPNRPVRDMPAADLEGARMDADLQFALHVKEFFRELRPGRPEKIDGHDTYLLVAEADGQPRARLYFNQQSGLLVRLVRYSDSPLGLNPNRIDFSDYRRVDGVQVPYRWTLARPAGEFTIQVTDVKQNVAIDDARFAKPAGAELTTAQ